MTRRTNLEWVFGAQLHGEAWQLAVEQGSIADAIALLRELAHGRNDLLAREAGITAGGWTAHPDTCQGIELLVAGLLIQAGSPLPFSELPHWVAIGRHNATTSNEGPTEPTQLQDD